MLQTLNVGLFFLFVLWFHATIKHWYRTCHPTSYRRNLIGIAPLMTRLT